MRSVKLVQLGNFRNGLNYTANDTDGNCYILGIPDFSDNYIAPTTGLKTISGDVVPQDLFLQKNDILFVRSNGNKALVGRTMLIKETICPTTFSGFCIRFRPNTDMVDPVYMLYLFKSPTFRKRFSSTQQTSIANLNQDTLANMQIDLPSMEQQKYISSVLNCLTEKINLNKQINDNLSHQSLMVA